MESLSEVIRKSVQRILSGYAVGVTASFTFTVEIACQAGFMGTEAMTDMVRAALISEGRDISQTHVVVIPPTFCPDFTVEFKVPPMKAEAPATSWKDRVQVERDELSARMQKLQEF